jgi:propanol-preferring alcohol dehydrogenase
VNPYNTLIGYEAEVIGSNDHLLSELPLLMEMAQKKVVDTSHVVSQVIALDADKINRRLDDLENFTSDVRAVIVPS